MGQHRAYLATFLRAHAMLLRGDGPLAAPVRHYLALMAAGRHACAHLVESHRLDFLADGGDPAWIRDGLAGVPPKIRALGELNKLLAHRPWAIGPAHIEARIETIFIFGKKIAAIYVPVQSETFRLLHDITRTSYVLSTKKIPRQSRGFPPTFY
jgi:hypothetical protein